MNNENSLRLWFTDGLLIDVNLDSCDWSVNEFTSNWVDLYTNQRRADVECFYVQSGFCQAGFLEAQPPREAFARSVCPRRLSGFSANKRVAEVVWRFSGFASNLQGN